MHLIENMVIYRIKNTINNKVYIGKTIQKFQCRKSSHVCSLNNGKHKNLHLLKSWNKYGEKSFIFDIIDNCSKENINEREVYWISFYNSFNENFGYNKTKGGDGGLGVKMSKKNIQLLIDRNKNMIWTDEIRKKVGEKSKEFQKKYWTKEKRELARKRMFGNSFKKGKNHTDEFKERCRINSTGRRHSDITKEKCRLRKLHYSKAIICIETGRNIPSLKEAGRIFKTSPSNIKLVCEGKAKTCKKHTFKYLN
ncbi:putative GIY-YIG domain-containing protein [Gammaproteobacteria bacterium]